MQTHEPGSKYTRHSGAGARTPRLRGLATLQGPVANGIRRKLHSPAGLDTRRWLIELHFTLKYPFELAYH